ncbi:hypothetical protein ACLBYF_34330, partial [Methylobacterium brachiatum]
AKCFTVLVADNGQHGIQVRGPRGEIVAIIVLKDPSSENANAVAAFLEDKTGFVVTRDYG